MASREQTRPERLRLDRLLEARGLFPSRSRTRDLIVCGHVAVDGIIQRKAGALTRNDAEVAHGAEAHDFVSRGGVKLSAALDAFGFEVSGRTALDLGASAGGFTDVLLRCGACHVTAVDVGRSQFHETLCNDNRVCILEQTDVRALTREHITHAPDAIVADLSFISLIQALPASLALAAPCCWLIALVKPQFEVGRDATGKRGIVTDTNSREAAVDGVAQWLDAQTGWRTVHRITSPLTGQTGNVEYLIGARRDG